MCVCACVCTNLNEICLNNNLEANDLIEWKISRIIPINENEIFVMAQFAYVLLCDCDEDPWAEPVNKPADPCDEPPDDPNDAFAMPLCAQERIEIHHIFCIRRIYGKFTWRCQPRWL